LSINTLELDIKLFCKMSEEQSTAATRRWDSKARRKKYHWEL